jgi:hypothetical protein
MRPIAPSHGENRGSSPLGSANDFNDVVALDVCRLATSPTFLQWTVLLKIGSRPPLCDRRLEEAEEIGAVTAEHRCLLIKMTRARIAARSAEQVEPTPLREKSNAKPPPDHLGIGRKSRASILPRSWH